MSFLGRHPWGKLLRRALCRRAPFAAGFYVCRESWLPSWWVAGCRWQVFFLLLSSLVMPGTLGAIDWTKAPSVSRDRAAAGDLPSVRLANGVLTPEPVPTPSPTLSSSPSATPTPSATATVTADPCDPDSETYVEPPFYRKLAYRWAPLIFQDTAHQWNADLLGRLDFDGDWRGNNNWNNLPANGIAPYVYYDVLETPTHWYLHYHTFHPRDWNDVLLGSCGPDPDCHENDTENLLVMVLKDGSPYGRFRVLQTMAHGNFYQYALAGDGVDNGVGADADDLDNDPERGFALFTDVAVGIDEPRPAVYIESKGHGICEWWDNNGPICSHPDDKVGTTHNDGLLYYPDEGAIPTLPPNPTGGNWYDYKVPYNLLSIWDDVWVLRSCFSGPDKTFDKPFLYPGVAGNGSAFIGKGLDGNDHADDAGTAWWAQTDGDNHLGPGDWTFDPAATVVRQLRFDEKVATTYLFNPYLGVLGTP